MATLAQKREITIALPSPIPIHLTYFTAWVEPDGLMHFRKDIYRRDSRLTKALEKEPSKENIIEEKVAIEEVPQMKGEPFKTVKEDVFFESEKLIMSGTLYKRP